MESTLPRKTMFALPSSGLHVIVSNKVSLKREVSLWNLVRVYFFTGREKEMRAAKSLL